MVVQLVAIGYVLRFIFALNNPAATLLRVLVMVLVAAREVAARAFLAIPVTRHPSGDATPHTAMGTPRRPWAVVSTFGPVGFGIGFGPGAGRGG